MIIDITLNDYKEIIASSKVIGKTYENKATILKFKLTDEAATKNFYLDIEKPNGTKFTTEQLNVENNIVEYEITNNLLDVDGFLKIEVILTDTDNYQMKYPALSFKVENSINATDALPAENPTLLSQIQNVIDIVDTTGDGTKYLSDDGTYKIVSSGSSNYDDLENKPIIHLTGSNENPIYMYLLETGKYLIDGICKPTEAATITLVGENTFLEVLKTNDIVHTIFKNVSDNSDNIITIAVDGSSYEYDSFNYNQVQLKTNITSVSRLLVSTTLLDNSSYQVTSNPSKITLNFPADMVNGYKSNFVFKTNGTLPTFICEYDIKWHGDAVIDNVFTMNTNKSYSIDFWKDALNFNAEVREVANGS